MSAVSSLSVGELFGKHSPPKAFKQKTFPRPLGMSGSLPLLQTTATETLILLCRRTQS